ncbi:VOC family protein [Nocardia sp. NPDC052566]|uniref:VOC family protein n=1 Tax=Nocardia sp. NPDC052566 TaxID=3364330 RepID=UPI0037C91D7B
MTKSHPFNLVDITVPKDGHEAAQRFYTQTFGWKVDVDLPGYPIFGTGDGGSQVGLMWEGNPQSGDMAKFWKTGTPVPFIGTDDIDATLAEVEKNGGEVAHPVKLAGAVKVATIEDPWGNVLFLWQPQY